MRLANEVRSAFSAEEEIDLITVQNLPFMLAVLDESMRLYSPVPSGSPRMINEMGDTILGRFIPPGVSTNDKIEIHTPANFRRLWLKSGTGPCITILSIFPSLMSSGLRDGSATHVLLAIKRNLSSHSPLGHVIVSVESKSSISFSLLRDNGLTDLSCTSLAYAEMRIILAKLVWKFDFKLSKQSRDWYSHSRVYMAWQKEPLYVHLMQRTMSS